MLYSLHKLVLDFMTDWPEDGLQPFCICRSREGDFTFTILFTSYSLACIRASFDLTALYLNVMLCLIMSSDEAMNSSESSSMNLYSMFYMKSNAALPSLCMTKTAKKE